jgi:SM-20-related protein
LREEEDRRLTRLALELAERGYSVTPSFLDLEEVTAWSEEAASSWREGAFRPAGVGRGDTFRIQPEVRNDQVRWLEPLSGSPIERRHFERMEELRLVLNRELYLGLLGFEAHLSVFPEGARYRCHLDQFRNAYHRIVSAILYLNPDWAVEDGGALRLYLEEPESEPFEDVSPMGGTLVLFLSARFHHEVLPARRDRLAATGWFTRRP